MTSPPDETRCLLEAWHGGDQDALGQLVARHLPWIRDTVDARLGGRLREKGEVDDYVQETLVEVLRYGPRFVADGSKFRGLLAKVIENVVRGQHDHFHALRRAMDREKPILRDTVLYLDPPQQASVTRPSQNAQANEGRAMVQAHLGQLSPEDREIMMLRQWEGLPFEEIGERLGIQANTARMRFQRALQRFGERVRNAEGDNPPN